MMEEKKEIFFSYVKANVVPILEDIIFGEDLPDGVVLPSTISKEELNGHYEGTEYIAPNWYKELILTNTRKLLVIDRIDKIPLSEQEKFCELLKYRKISTFELPKNVVIIITAKDINKDTINEEIFSLVAVV